MRGIGDTLGDYKLLSLIGGGGAGNVYLAEYLPNGNRVALKVPHPHHLSNRELLSRFFREARAINGVRHENVVDIVDFVEQSNIAFYAMEFLDGETLDDLMEREPEDLTLIDRLRIAGQISSALTAAHKVGVVHRDLKPANVVILERPFERYFVKLLDFGAAVLRPGGQLSLEGSDGIKTMIGHVIGTPGYMAPEALIGGKSDHRIDIYAFGVLLYELIAGQQPFDAPSLNKLLMKHVSAKPKPMSELEDRPYIIPDELSDLALRCLAKKPEDRPSEMREVGAALVKISNIVAKNSAAAIIVKRDPTAPEVEALTPEPPPRKRRLRVFLFAIVVFGITGAGCWLAYTRGLLPPAVERFVRRGEQRVTTLLHPARTDRLPGTPHDSFFQLDANLGPSPTDSALGGNTESDDDRTLAPADRGKRRVRHKSVDRRGRRRRHEEANRGDGDRADTTATEEARVSATTEAVGPATMAVHEAHYRQAKLYSRQGKYLFAIDSLNRCLALAPDYAPAHRALGAANLKLGRTKKAIDSFKAFLVRAPNDPSAADVQGIVDRYELSKLE